MALTYLHAHMGRAKVSLGGGGCEAVRKFADKLIFKPFQTMKVIALQYSG